MNTRYNSPADWARIIILGIFSVLFFNHVSLAEEKKEPPSVTSSQPLKLSGYTQVQYNSWDKGADGFAIRRARLSLSGEILKFMQYKLQVDVLKSPALLDASLDFNLDTNLILRVGQFKIPFSLENLTSSSDVDTINRSQTEEKLCPGRDIGSQGRDIGATLYGKFSIVEFTAGIFNGSGINRADTNEQKDIAGRLILHPVEFLTLGAAFYEGQYSPAAGAPSERRDRTGVEMTLNYSALSIKGEYILGKDAATARRGWYLQGGYFILPKKLQAVLKYDSYDHNKDISLDRSDLLTLGVNWFLSGKTKLIVNFELYRDESGKTSHQTLLAMFQAHF